MFSDLRTQVFRIWFRIARPMTLGVRAIVENAEGQVLLVRHTYTPGLYLPGGGIERGETVRVSLHRELEEEGGLLITGETALIGIFSNHRVMRNDHVILYKIEASAWRSVRDPRGLEISDILWCNPFSPPEDATPATLRRLKEHYQGAERSDHW
ncbi:MAG: NUDIX domain-containing protein [Pseudomonadota bacterium]